MPFRWMAVVGGVFVVAACGRSGTDLGEIPDRRVPVPQLAFPVPAFSPVPLCTSTSQDLIACYEFEGNGADGSTYGRDAAVTGATYQQGPFGSYVVLTSSSGIQIADDAVFGGPVLTYEMWLNASGLPSTGAWYLVDKSGEYRFRVQSGGTFRGTCGGGDSAETVGGIAAYTWTHVAFVVGGGSMEIFVDGVSRATDGGCNIVPAGTEVHLGEDDGGTNEFRGGIDRVRIWRRARTPQEICAEAQTC